MSGSFAVRRAGTFPVRLYYTDDVLAFREGGLVDHAARVRLAGRNGDTELVHINKDELEELTRNWGPPSINPETGMPEFFLKKVWKGIKKIAPVALPIAASFIPVVGPAIGAALGATGATGAALGSTLLGAGIGGLTGGWKGALSGAATGLIGSQLNRPPLGLDPSGTMNAVGPQTAATSSVTDMPSAGSNIDVPSTTPAVSSSPLPSTDDFIRSTTPGTGVEPRRSIVIPSLSRQTTQQAPQQTTGGPLGFLRRDFLGTGIPTWVPLASLAMTALSRRGGGGKGPDIEAMRDRFYTQGYATGGHAMRGEPRKTFAVRGPGTGRSDDIPAVLSDGEYVMDAETVALLGDGSSAAGAKKLDDFRINIRKHKGRHLAKGKFSANAKRPEAYLAGGAA